MSAFNGKWTVEDLVDGKNFISFCDMISKDRSLFDKFKTHSNFIPIIGNDIRSKQMADQLHSKVCNNPKVLAKLKQYKTNDLYGSPCTYNLPSPFSTISPGTMIFIEEVQDISNNLIDLFDSKLKIVEIGGGYGGLAKIIMDSGNHDYAIVDYQEVLNLSSFYVSLFQKQISQIPILNIPGKLEFDLVISNWCLSELDDVGIYSYYSTIIKNCKFGYFKMNLWDQTRKNMVIDLFKRDFNVVVSDLDEHQRNCTNWKMMVKAK